MLKNVHSYEITSICFLKDGAIASSDNYILIYNKNRIKEKEGISYMNVNKNGILITCEGETNINLYEIKRKKYKNIQTIKPYSLLSNILSLLLYI